MKREIFIYGAGGLGREVLSMLTGHPRLKVNGFIDDQKAPGESVCGLPVFPQEEIFNRKPGVVIAIGDPPGKSILAQKLKSQKVELISVIHPSVIIQSPSVKIGAGCIIGAGTILTTDINIAENVLINLAVTIGHDVSIGECTSVMPGTNIAGGVHIGKSVLIGAGVNIINGIRIGDESRVGMGAVVIDHVQPGVTVVGVPAKPVSK